MYEHPPRHKDRRGVSRAVHAVLGERTVKLLRMDLARAAARARGRLRGDARQDLVPTSPLVHVGCGRRSRRRVDGWLNVDITGSDFDVDLASGRLPWRDASVEAFVSQHVIEHLELDSELVPLLTEMRRVLRPDGEVWLSCPDLATACRSYVDGTLDRLVEDRRARNPGWRFEGVPASQLVNDLFTQQGEHVNLFDEELLRWALRRAGFGTVERVREADLLARFPGFPPRHDDVQSLYVRATGRATGPAVAGASERAVQGSGTA